MSQFLTQFQKAKGAKPITDFAKNLPLGRHVVALDVLRGKESSKNKEIFIEAEFVVLESETAKPGQRYGWAWFINAGSWTGQYASARLNEFLLTIKESVNSPQEIDELGDALANESTKNGKGICLLVEIVEVPDPANPGKCLKSKKNNRDVHNANWTVVEQDEADIASSSAKMDELEAAVASTPKPAQSKPAGQTSSTQPRTATGGIKSLLRPATTK